ncbi:MerR family transcriptional regulator [Actibacterium mucosum KCTC 23349]|uniref:MerR family transcriptional regulator n=2 Tax=Actibacterium TaxID=1433986 RepID=A0A037ZH72_9RHOB|nr:MerR family transcriptional regulator [Actibacterium mucosum KCTC 23349]
MTSDLTVGEMAARSGVAVSALHFYEAEGLIQSWRTPANHRRYDRRELRRVAIIKVAQTLGVPLAEVREVLDALPRDRPISAAQWNAAGQVWHNRLTAQIEALTALRDQMGSCIGCGCLSLENCPLYNPEDIAGRDGPGPRRWTRAKE